MHVLRKDENDWVKKCMDFEVEGVRPRGRQKKAWGWVKVTEKDVRPDKCARNILWTVENGEG